MMIGMVVKKVQKIPEEKRDQESKDMLKTYNKKADFVDFEH